MVKVRAHQTILLSRATAKRCTLTLTRILTLNLILTLETYLDSRTSRLGRRYDRRTGLGARLNRPGPLTHALVQVCLPAHG